MISTNYDNRWAGFKFYAFFIAKGLETAIRHHLSAALACILAVWTIVLEWHKIAHWPPTIGLPYLLLIIGTILAALWELVGDKFSLSPMQARFITAMQILLAELEKVTYGKDREPDVSKRLDRFIQDFLNLTSVTFSSGKKVDSGVMLFDPNTNSLRLMKSSMEAEYPEELLVPIPTDKEYKMTGPAGVSYQELKVSYTPNWEWNRLLIHDLISGETKPSQVGWIPTPRGDLQKIKSVLCFPIAAYHERNQKVRYGVLCYSTPTLEYIHNTEIFMGGVLPRS